MLCLFLLNLVHMKNQLNILVAPLDWGLGHASRCVPIIELLLKRDCNVVIAADNYAYDFLKRRFPRLQFVRLKGYNVRYAKKFVALKVFSQLPKIIFSIAREKFQLSLLLKEFSIDAVISDNRFGLWSKSAYSVFITHQILIKLPKPLRLLEKPLYKINKFVIEQFNECWVPDFPGETNLTGDLTRRYKLPANAKFIHPLSRFSPTQLNVTQKYLYDFLAVFSGPEPQRTLLEEKILKQLKNSNVKACIVRGTPGQNEKALTASNVKLIPFADGDELLRLISQSKVLLCRAGYSTIMDLTVLRKPAVLTPTPGQTEQEYLAKYLGSNGFFEFVEQNNISINEIISRPPAGNFPFENNDNKLVKIIEEFVERLNKKQKENQARRSL